MITIVIPSKNEEKYIGKTLHSISQQQDLEPFEIIIADAGSTDKTIEKINECKKKYNLKVKIIKGGLPSVGRNNGAKLVKTPYILFLDSDITFTSTRAIADSLHTIKYKNYDMVSTCPKYQGEFDIRANIMFLLNRFTSHLLSLTYPFAIGGFTLVKTEVFNELGGYDKKATQAEDWLFSKQIKPSKFYIIPNLITQDNRRFKRYGYTSMFKLVLNNLLNRNNKEYFYKDQGYWK